MPSMAFDFQQFVIEKSCSMGRYADFLDTGLGKTLVELSIAHNVVLKTNGRILILTPLAVAAQFIKQAEEAGIDDVEKSLDGKFTKKIILANYERLHLFNPDDFECVILDESSILKNFNGAIKTDIIAFMRKIKYRFLATATPSPNDFTELGNSSEALGYLGYMDMLTRFFKQNSNSIDSNNRNIGEKFYLKPHAERDFFRWVNQWSLMARRPSDLGNFSDERYVLPDLLINQNMVEENYYENESGQFSLIPNVAVNMSEIRIEQKKTYAKRCEKAVELASGKTSVYWCNTNDESTLLNSLDDGAVELKGSMSIEQKEEILFAFAEGAIIRLITKASMTSMGLNWQHCAHSVMFPTFSYEQRYQAIRRFWRFGQQFPVVIDDVLTPGQERIIKAQEQKAAKAALLFENLVKNTNSNFQITAKAFDKQAIIPGFLQ